VVPISSLEVLEGKNFLFQSGFKPSNPLPSNCSPFIFVRTCSMYEPFSYIFFVSCIFYTYSRMLVVILIMTIGVEF
jgi:hypothetical protein